MRKVSLLTLKALLILAAALACIYCGARYGPPLVERIRGTAPPPGDVTAPEDPPEEPVIDEEEYARILAIVDDAAETYRAAPVNAVYNSAYNIVLPGLNGYEIDREQTAGRLAAVEPGEAVAPVWGEIEPSVTVSDYPAAVINQGNPAFPRVTLMINVAWGNEYLPEMLSILDEHGIRTTFYPVGRWAERFPDLLAEIAGRGHEMGNHGYDDREVMPDLDREGAIESLSETNRIVSELTGAEPRYFTPHKGEYNRDTLEAAAALEMRLLLWTLDTIDWQLPGEEVMARRILDNLVPGAIILMHPTEQSAGFLRLLLPELERRGYVVVTTGELLSPRIEFPEIRLQR